MLKILHSCHIFIVHWHCWPTGSASHFPVMLDHFQIGCTKRTQQFLEESSLYTAWGCKRLSAAGFCGLPEKLVFACCSDQDSVASTGNTLLLYVLFRLAPQIADILLLWPPPPSLLERIESNWEHSECLHAVWGNILLLVVLGIVIMQWTGLLGNCGSVSDRGERFVSVWSIQTSSGVLPVSCSVGTMGSCSRRKTPRAWSRSLTPSSAEVKNECSSTSNSPICLSGIHKYY